MKQSRWVAWIGGLALLVAIALAPFRLPLDSETAVSDLDAVLAAHLEKWRTHARRLEAAGTAACAVTQNNMNIASQKIFVVARMAKSFTVMWCRLARAF